MNIRKISIYLLLLIIGASITVLIYTFFNPLPSITIVKNYSLKSIENKSPIKWPQYGSQSIGIVGYGVNNQTGNDVPQPVASTIKVLLALSVIEQKPLNLNEQGPTITISQADVDNYNADLSLGESVVKVTEGETISEYQALQALLIASANNFAQVLADWAFGSTTNYLKIATKFAKNIGMQSTTLNDVSGYSTLTVSNSFDLTTLGQSAIINPVIADIVDQYTANIPVAGKIINYNSNLNPVMNTKINGIKTGNTTSGGGNYIYSSKYLGYTIVGSIVGTPDLNTALSEGPIILNAYENLIKIDKIVSKYQIVGYYKVPWQENISIISPDSQFVPVEPNTKYSLDLALNPLVYAEQNHSAGFLIVTNNRTEHRYPLQINGSYSSPSFWWRIKYSLKEII